MASLIFSRLSPAEFVEVVSQAHHQDSQVGVLHNPNLENAKPSSIVNGQPSIEGERRSFLFPATSHEDWCRFGYTYGVVSVCFAKI